MFEDLRIVMTIFGIVYVFYWVYNNIHNKVLATLVLMAALYYFIFYSPGLFQLIIVLAALLFFREFSAIGDIYFQYTSARDLDMRAMAEEERRMVMTPMGPRWRE